MWVEGVQVFELEVEQHGHKLRHTWDADIAEGHLTHRAPTVALVLTCSSVKIIIAKYAHVHVCVLIGELISTPGK